MAEEKKYDFVTQDTADKILKKYPTQVVSTTPTYPVMDTSAEGSWRIIEDGDIPVGILWTDWANSAGIVVTKSGKKTDEVFKYLSTNKSLGALPGMAYSSAQLIDGLQFSEEYSGELKSVLDIASQLNEIGEK